MNAIRLLSALPLLLALAACESTSFEAAPVAEAACDPGLPGTWESIDEGGKNGEVRLAIDSDCELLMSEDKDGQTVTGEPTRLHVGHDGDASYLWVDAAWAVKRFELEHAPPPGDIYLLHYRLADDRLELRLPDSKAIAHRLIDNQLHGEVQRDESILATRLEAPLEPERLRDPGFFEDNVAAFRRTGGPKP